ncbi:helix-turn-helix domain-containing protein [Planomicrobium sp. CPCC 101079]|uniref:helix-turn-helix domain-containing protein n=1 Tax=Planomicrobium sp. CPCC 101079 TaxID=2599618 RepID=UPI0011B4A820|nr:helix-turn-helix transcriptional regulator [Planomicrobium sp. CPCC 101079]TWT00133.1 helix-turn-helix transcriptional regulator [Planomicrobium sp. CPCC 101079]
MKNLIAGQLIKEYRKEKNFKLIEFAKEINMAQSSLSRIENGTRELSISVLTNICNGLGISLSEFFLKLEGKQEILEPSVEFSKESSNEINEDLDSLLHSTIASLTTEQKKGLYILLFPYSK